MEITTAASADVEVAVHCLATAFARDPITGYLLGTDAGYDQRVARFFSLLLRARIALGMPAFVARGPGGIVGAAMGYSTAPPSWPAPLAEEWARFERSIPGVVDRMAIYDGVAARFKPEGPHYYLGVIGTDPAVHGRGIGAQFLKSFCAASYRDPANRTSIRRRRAMQASRHLSQFRPNMRGAFALPMA